MDVGRVLLAAGVCALAVAVLSYALGAAQVGTMAGMLALLASGGGLAVLDQAGRATAELRRNELTRR